MEELAPSGAPDPRSPTPRPTGFLVSAVLLVLAIAWCAAPFLAFGALMESARFFGEEPNTHELARAHLYEWLAAGGGLLGPAAGFAIGLGTRNRPIAVGFAVLLMISLGGLIIFVLLS